LKIKEHKDMKLVEMKLELKKLQTQIDEITLDDYGERRKDITSNEYGKVQGLLDQQDELVNMIKTEERMEKSREELREPVEKWVGAEDALDDYESRSKPIFAPGEKRTSRKLFGLRDTSDAGFKSLSELMGIIGRNQYDPRLKGLEKQRAMTEGIPSDGGYMIPSAMGEMLLDPVLEQSIVLARADVRPMKSNVEDFPAWGVGNHSVDVYDGIVAYFVEEAGSFTETTPKTRNVKLNAKKLGVLTTVSNEWLNDLPGSDAQLTDALSKAISWYADYYLLQGVGGAQPLGVVNSKCIVNVAKETGQVADTIYYQNLKKMFARMLPGCRKNAIWIVNDDTIPELLEVTIPIGTSGAHYPVLQERNGNFQIFGKQVITSEKMPKLGDANDIIFVDLTQYLVGLRYNVQIAKSPHVDFKTDKMAYRLLMRFDGQMKQDEALTPKKSTTNTLSSVVGLAERA